MELHDWLTCSTILLALALALYLFFRTPKNERTLQHHFDVRRAQLEKRLATYPESAGAVLLKSNRKRAILNHLPIIGYFAFVAMFAFYTTRVLDNPVCDTTFGANTAFLMAITAFYAFPFGLFLWSLFFVKTGLKTLKTGYFPPLDSIQLNDTIATKTFASRIRGYGLVASPVVFVLVLAYTHHMFMSFTGHEPKRFFRQIHEEQCTTGASETVRNP
jgi:hypothetical protein